MSIQIIDGFQVNTALPIDNRIVASGSVARNAIPYKYEGLRVFDTFDGIPYVWLNGAWVGENASGVAGAGSASHIPLYTSSNVIGNSLLYQSGYNILTVDAGGGANKISMNANNGLIIAAFSGNGAQVTNIDAGNISSGQLSLSRLTNGSTNYILTGGSGAPVYTDPSQVTVGTASVASSVVVSSTGASGSYYLPLISSLTPNSVIKSNSGLSFDASTGITTIPILRFGDAYTYTQTGRISYSVSTGGAVTFQIGSLSVPSTCLVVVEATFATRNYPLFIMGGYSTNRGSKMMITFKFTAGTATTIGSIQTIYNQTDSPQGSYPSSYSSIDTPSIYAGSSVVNFAQNAGNSSGYNYKTCVDYKLTITTV